MKSSLALALGILAVVAYAEAGGDGHPESMYNKNTNINSNKNMDKAAVWSYIWDSLFSSQWTMQQEEQLQQCFMLKECGMHFMKIVDEEFEKPAKDGEYKEEKEMKYDDKYYDGHDCSVEPELCGHGYGQPRYARIYNVNTNTNYDKNKVAADLLSRIWDRLSAYQRTSQSEAQKQA